MCKSQKFLNSRAYQSQPKTGIFSAMPASLSAGIALVAIATFLAYLPCLNGRFVLDDDVLLMDNSLIQSQDGLHRFWCTAQPMDFWPATSTTFWIEWRLWGPSPGGYHVTSLILHILESLLIWIILRRLSILGAFLAALIFAVHPVNVESVAWISQRKNLVAMLCFQLSILWYFKAGIADGRKDATPSRSHGGPWERDVVLWYCLSLAAFVLAMLGKGSAAVLPVLLLMIVWWLRGLARRDFVRTAPFFLIALLLTAVNVWFQTHGAEIVTRSADFGQRLLVAAAWCGSIFTRPFCRWIWPLFTGNGRSKQAVRYGGFHSCRPWPLQPCCGDTDEPGAGRYCLPGCFTARPLRR